MRTVTSDFATSLKNESTTFARLWTLTRADGKVVRLTDADSNIMNSGNVYISSIGFTSTAVMASSLSITAQNVELVVPLTDLGITEDDLRHRTFEEAKAVMEIIDYENPSHGTMILFSGIVGRVVLSDKHRASVEVVSSADQNLNIASEQYSSGCRNDLGDARCTFNIFSFATNFTVVSDIDQMGFTVDTLNGQADDFYALGQIKWLTGLNAGLVSDVRTNSLGLLAVGLFYPLPFPIVPGDTGTLLSGCDKQVPTCLEKFNNVLNFRGEPFAPAFGQ